MIHRTLITGGTGFIGSHLRPILGGEVYTPTEAELDLTSEDSIKRWFVDYEPTHIIHLAAKTEVALSFENYAEVGNVNYLGTVRLAEAARRHTKSLKHFIFASTMETYGDAIPYGVGYATEDTPQQPLAPYAVAKVAAEHYLKYMGQAYGFPYTILRQTNAYGRVNTDFFVMEKIISQMLAEKPVVRLGASWPERNFLFIDDLINLYDEVIHQPSKSIFQTFVTGPDNALTINLLVGTISLLLGWRGNIEWNTMPSRPGEVPRLNSYAGKAKAFMGWEPTVSLEDGILRTAEKWRNRGRAT